MDDHPAEAIVARTAHARVDRKIATPPAVANDNLFHDFSGDYPEAIRGVTLAEAALQEVGRKRRQELLQQAQTEFETALAAIPLTAATLVPRRRVHINLAIVLRRAGRLDEAIPRLEAVCDTMAGDQDWALDGPRALDALGNAYMSVTPPRTQDAIAAYLKAQRLLEGRSQRRDPFRNQLLARVLSNLTTAYIEENDPLQAMEAVNKSLGLLSRTKDQPVWGRTQRIKAEVLNLQAAAFVEEGQFPQARAALTQAIESFEEARQSLRDYGSMADWAEITATLAGAESNLGNVLANDPSVRTPLDGVMHFRQAIPLYLEAFAALGRVEDRAIVREELGRTLNSLLAFSNDFGDLFLAFSACQRVNSTQEFAYDAFHRSILMDVARKFLRGVLSVSGLTEAEKVSVLADLMALVALSENEAPSILTAAFEQLQWSNLSLMSSRSRSGAVEATTLALPDKAPTLYEQRPKGQTIVDYLRDPNGWGPYVAAGILSRTDLKRLDPKAYKAVDNWLSHDPFPDDIRLLKKADLTDLIVQQHPNPADLPANILAALRSRQVRKKNK